MATLIMRLIRDDAAQGLAEYGIAMTVVAVGVGAIAVAIVGNIMTLWTTAGPAIAAAV